VLNHEIYFTNKSRPWIVFIHGAGGSIQTWNYQLSEFKGDANLLLLDLRDHGKSQNMSCTGKYNFQLISKDIIQVLDHVGITKAVFLTLSFGSVLLQDLALHWPGRIQAAVLAGGIFRANWRIRTFVYLARFLNLLLSYRQMYTLFSYLLMPRKEHQFSRRIYRIQAQKITPSAYMRWLGLYNEFFRLLERFWNQQLHFPALVIMGAQDFVFLHSARSFAANRSNVYLEVVENAGHICNIDNPEAFNRTMKNFLNRSLMFSDAPVKPSAEV